MLLIDPAAAAEAIGARCGPTTGADSPGIIAALRYITPAVEALLEVESLEAKQNTDYFVCPRDELRDYSLSLSNAFVAPSTVIVTDPDGVVLLDETDFRTSSVIGQIMPMEKLSLGEYKVTYVSGFSVAYPEDTGTPLTEEDEANLVAEGVPDWIKGIVITLLVEWYRSKPLVPKVPDNVSINGLVAALRSDLRRRIGSHYYRPRYCVIFAEPK